MASNSNNASTGTSETTTAPASSMFTTLAQTPTPQSSPADPRPTSIAGLPTTSNTIPTTSSAVPPPATTPPAPATTTSTSSHTTPTTLPTSSPPTTTPFSSEPPKPAISLEPTLTTSARTVQSIVAENGTTSTAFVTQTIITAPTGTTGANPTTPSTATIQTSTPTSSSSSDSHAGTIAVAVVVPIAAVAILVALGLWLWRKRKVRKAAEEERRKEVEDYTYNPNADPTIPGSGGVAYEMKEDSSSGYRGWGSTTLTGSSGRKASTILSGGVAAGASSDAPYSENANSDGTSPTHATYPSDPLSGNDDPHSPEGEILGAMGPSTANNPRGNVRRGPSNASSSYSTGAPSDESGEIGVAHSDGPGFAQNDPYFVNQYGSPPGGQPVIRDNPARRNARIENPSHYPHQSAGISQNF